MKVTVCFQVVPDLGLVPDGKLPALPEQEIQGNYPRILDTYDESALELALRLRDHNQDIVLCAVTVSRQEDSRIYESLYALGFAEVIRVDCAVRPFASKTKACLLAARMQDSGLILTGRQSGLSGSKMTPRYLAETMGYPYVDNVCSLEEVPGGIFFRASGEGKNAEGTITAPAVMMVGDGGWLRIPTLRAKLAAKKKQCRTVSEELFLQDEVFPVALHCPPAKAECRWIGGQPSEQAKKILSLLEDKKTAREKEKMDERCLRKTYGGVLIAEYAQPVPKLKRMSPRDDTWITAYTETDDGGTADLKNAELVLVAGRGVDQPDMRAGLSETAAALGAMVGATRAAVLAGWYPAGMLIGISGLSLHSRAVVLFGASGAAALTAGLEQCGLVIAVNKDTEAPVFRRADYGIKGDCGEILGELKKAVEEIKRR